MRKIIAIVLFSASLFYLISSGAFAQEKNPPIKDSATTIVGTGENSPGDTGQEPGPGPAPDCTDSNLSPINNAIKQDFGISIQEGPPPEYSINDGGTRFPGAENVNCKARQGFWKIFSIATQSWKYKKRLLTQSSEIQFFTDPLKFSFGYTGSPDRMQLKNGAARVKDNFISTATWITHESGHWLQHRDNSLENNFDVNWFKDHGDNGCYVGNFLKTYGCIDCNVSSTRESMAEAIALYVYNKKVRYNDNGSVAAAIGNFKEQCRATHDWVGDKIFNNYEFGF